MHISATIQNVKLKQKGAILAVVEYGCSWDFSSVMADKMNGEEYKHEDYSSSEQHEKSFVAQKGNGEGNLRLAVEQKTEFMEVQGGEQENCEVNLRKFSGDQNDPTYLNRKSAKYKGHTCDPCVEGEEVGDKGNCDNKRRQHVSKQYNKDNPPGNLKLNKDRDNVDRTDTDKAKKVLEEFVDNATQNSSSQQGAAQGNYVVDPWKSGCIQLGEKVRMTNCV